MQAIAAIPEIGDINEHQETQRQIRNVTKSKETIESPRRTIHFWKLRNLSNYKASQNTNIEEVQDNHKYLNKNYDILNISELSEIRKAHEISENLRNPKQVQIPGES